MGAGYPQHRCRDATAHGRLDAPDLFLSRLPATAVEAELSRRRCQPKALEFGERRAPYPLRFAKTTHGAEGARGPHTGCECQRKPAELTLLRQNRCVHAILLCGVCEETMVTCRLAPYHLRGTLA